MKKIMFWACALMLTVACKDDPVQPTTTNTTNNNTNNPPAGSKHISFTMDGVSYSFVENVDGYNSSISTVGNASSTRIDTEASMYAEGPDPMMPENYPTVGFLNYLYDLQNHNNDKQAALATITAVGTHDYRYDQGSGGGGSFTFYFEDVQYRSDAELQDGNANFEVTSSETYENQMGYTIQEVEGTFNCKIHPTSGSGAAKTITNGSFKMLFEAP